MSDREPSGNHRLPADVSAALERLRHDLEALSDVLEDLDGQDPDDV